MSDDDFAGPYSLLTIIAPMVEMDAMTLGVSVLVDGAWVSGLMVSHRRYLDSVKTGLQSAKTHGTGDAMVRILDESLEKLVAALVSRDTESKKPGPMLYLLEATVTLGDGVVTTAPQVEISRARIGAFHLGAPQG